MKEPLDLHNIYAAAALVGLLSSEYWGDATERFQPTKVAELAHFYADAMVIESLKRKESGE
jgi:hypothetical protein